jgi:hypothetical protein
MNPRNRAKTRDVAFSLLSNSDTLQAQPNRFGQHGIRLATHNAKAHHGNSDDQQSDLYHGFYRFEQSDHSFRYATIGPYRP